jgi:diguanylate cyclase (GGDEF)-like protein/PAS domain S-box-containing protein
MPESAHPIEAALARISEAVIIADASNSITFMNRAAEEMTSWSAADAVGEPLSQVFLLSSAVSGARRDLGLAVDSDPPRSITWRPAALVDKAGSHVPIEYSAAEVRDAGGRRAGVTLVFRDVMFRQEVEAALRRSEESALAHADALFEERERAQVTLNSIGDAVISTDFRGRVSYLNIVAQKMCGWTQAEAAGREIDEVFPLVETATSEPASCLSSRAIIENRRVGREAVCSLMRRDGAEIAVEDSAAPIHDRNGRVIGAVMVAHDVTVAREQTTRLARLALHDNLTNVPNRALFNERLAKAMIHARAQGHSVALLYVDLDRFKRINDTWGHAVGDQVLQTVAQRLLACVRSSDTVCRLGGDEFVVLLENVAHERDAGLCAETVIRSLNEPYQLGEQTVCMSASIGIAAFPGDTEEADSLLKCADQAMYEVKFNGRNGLAFFKGGGPVHS